MLSVVTILSTHQVGIVFPHVIIFSLFGGVIFPHILVTLDMILLGRGVFSFPLLLVMFVLTFILPLVWNIMWVSYV